jgi:hypothetical protein
MSIIELITTLQAHWSYIDWCQEQDNPLWAYVEELK